MSQTRIGIAVSLSQGKVSAIMNGSAQVTALEVFERVADGLAMPDLARIALGLAPRNSRRRSVRRKSASSNSEACSFSLRKKVPPTRSGSQPSVKA
ncbi:hypothetical protein [Sphaerisporangium sp. NBC_01403]|uniref:hypothetical protein n=1 Tax=Sphaerisporangium sp. NBC_01403 TaxID=2903599 RepID=UPI0038650F75